MNRRLAVWVVNGLLLGLAIVSLFPLLWMVSVSFMPPGASSVLPTPILPRSLTLHNYQLLFGSIGMGRYLLHTRYGLINQALAGIGIDPVNWLGDPHWSMPAIILFSAWKNFGYNMIILLAALQAVPREVYESARVDGAGAWRQFFDMTIPMLMPTLVMVGIMTVSGYFQLFAEPYVMTQGGPLRSTVSVLYFMYEEGFRWWNLGNASAVAFLLFLVIFAVSWVLLRFDRDPEGKPA